MSVVKYPLLLAVIESCNVNFLFAFQQRMDLGECTKIHDLALRADYEIASKERDLFFELDVSLEVWVTTVINAYILLDSGMRECPVGIPTNLCI